MSLNTIVTMRTGRKLEVREYGDPGGHPLFFFHGLIGSHHQASYIAEQARRQGLRILAPNRPGVGKSEFVDRRTPLDAVDDVEDMAAALGLEDFSLIGISGGTPYVLAALHRLRGRVRTATLISGMGPLRLRGALKGMEAQRRLMLQVGSRYPHLVKRTFRRMTDRFRQDPGRFLDGLIATWSTPDQVLFRQPHVYQLFMNDLHAVFIEGQAPESLAQQLVLFRHYGFRLNELPQSPRVTLWQGLEDNIVPPVMAWTMSQALPNCEAHFIPGGHFVAIEAADTMVARLRQQVDAYETRVAAAKDGTIG